MELLDDVLQAVQFLDGFNELIKAMSCVPSSIVFQTVKTTTLSSLLTLMHAFV